jgi:kynurenine formamidase
VTEPILGQAGGTVSPEEFAELHHRCSNWGRWGADDQRGALNLITAHRTASAAALVSSGVSVSCAHPLDTEPAIDNPKPARHEMSLLPWPESPHRGGVGFASDALAVHCHGEVHSHLDALCHVGYRGQLFNGHPSSSVTETGAVFGGLEQVGPGIATRAVLLDVPRFRGVSWLDPGEMIGAEELTAVAQAQNVQLEPGDALLLRTGHGSRRRVEGPWDASMAKAGLHPRAMPWLAERDIAVFGCDADGDPAPHPCGSMAAPIHVLGINAMGLIFLDALNLDDVAGHCANLHRWEFFFVVQPIRLSGATGCVVNPLAIF